MSHSAQPAASDKASDKAANDAPDVAALRTALADAMWEHVGVYRHGKTLGEVLAALAELPTTLGPGREAIETANMRLVGELIVRAALERTESRGAHYREDYPDADDARWLRNLSLARLEDGGMELTTQDQGFS